MTLRRTLVLSLFVVVAIPAVALAANTFGDDDGSLHEGSIEAIAKADITRGCNPPQNDEFCPDRDLKRGEMAAFLVRALDLPNTDADHFDDDEGSPFERDINRLAEAGITKGCNPPENDEFCSDESITRGQMAAFLARALSLSDAGGDTFNDDDGSTFENDIERIAAKGITRGCNPPTNDRYCPDDATTRDEMATFLTRALDLEIPPTDDHPTLYDEGEITGDACPCKVTGSVELTGQVNLQGDLVVDGGTLVARPGVDLDGNGFQIMFMNGGKADFRGSEVFTWSDRGAKQNLKRDINFGNLQRIMFHSRAGSSILKYFTVSNSGTSALGDYPLHWHLNGDSTRGTIVEGVVVRNGKHHAFVPHGSHGITFKDVIAKDTADDAFWWDSPGTHECDTFRKLCTLDNSNDIVYDRALVDGVTNGPGNDRDFHLTGFMLGAGSGNVIRNSAAININPSHVKDCAGFQWPGKANQNVGGNVWVAENLYSFSGPSGPSDAGGPENCHGIFVWQNDGNHHVIDGVTGGGIDHGAYKNNYEYHNVNVPYVEVHARGASFVGGNVGVVVAGKHQVAGSADNPTAVFKETAIDRLTIRNGNGEPGYYVFNSIGLTCSDVTEESVASGTVVVIDGDTC